MSKVKSYKSNVQRKASGFTLVELLVVMLILAVLFAIVLIAINPVRQRQQANNAQRRNDVNVILNAVYQFAADNGRLPLAIEAGETNLKVIGTATFGCDAQKCGDVFPQGACANLAPDLTPRYIFEIPQDPKTGSEVRTRYAIFRTAAENRVTVRACDAELDEEIEVSR